MASVYVVNPETGKLMPKPLKVKRVKRCDQCVMVRINGVACHEHGCPNARKGRK